MNVYWAEFDNFGQNSSLKSLHGMNQWLSWPDAYVTAIMFCGDFRCISSNVGSNPAIVCGLLYLSHQL